MACSNNRPRPGPIQPPTAQMPEERGRLGVTRRPGEMLCVRLGDQVVYVYFKQITKGGTATLVVDAPKSVIIQRGEIAEQEGD